MRTSRRLLPGLKILILFIRAVDYLNVAYFPLSQNNFLERVSSTRKADAGVKYGYLRKPLILKQRFGTSGYLGVFYRWQMSHSSIGHYLCLLARTDALADHSLFTGFQRMFLNRSGRGRRLLLLVQPTRFYICVFVFGLGPLLAL